MDESLAKGYATKFIADQRELSCITDWLESRHPQAATEKFAKAALAKKPGRVLSRMAKHLQPPFMAPEVGCWDRQLKAVFTGQMVAAHETDVFDMSIEDQAIFRERSVVLMDLLFVERSQRCDSDINMAANVSHHTIKRMLERGASTPSSLMKDILKILMGARALRQFLTSSIDHKLTGLKEGITYDFVLPFGDGGLILRTLRANPFLRAVFPSPMPVFSIRTFLDESMITSRQRERMAGFRLSKEARVSVSDAKHTMRWIDGNAEIADRFNKIEEHSV